MGYKEHSGRFSLKGLLINVFSLVVFVTPIVLCVEGCAVTKCRDACSFARSVERACSWTSQRNFGEFRVRIDERSGTAQVKGFEQWAWLWKANVGTFAVMFCAPPWGWKKPHPYSDQPPLR